MKKFVMILAAAATLMLGSCVSIKHVKLSEHQFIVRNFSLIS